MAPDETAPASSLTRARGPLAGGLVALALVAGAFLVAGARKPAPLQAVAPSATAAPLVPGSFVERLDVGTFRKGNLHTHSNWSDGDHDPADVYTWYREHGYAFLAMTDHNHRTDPALFKHLERPGTFVIIPGEEITMYVEALPVHVNALCHGKTIGGGHFPSVAAALGFGIGETLAQGGIALVNHPNFEWALTAKDVVEAKGARLLEIWSGHPYTRPAGDATHPSAEVIWDETLGVGLDYVGVGVDDSHHLRAAIGDDDKAAPGRVWVQVFSAQLDAKTLCADIQRGRLYTSTGPSLRHLTVGDATMTLEVEAGASLVEFVGAGGSVLSSLRPGAGEPASYKLAGGETYVRARVTGADGKRAWTQAYRVR